MKTYPQFLLLFMGLMLGTSIQAQISLNHISTYHTGAFDVSAAEIVAHDKTNNRLFFVNGNTATIDVLDISTPNTPVLVNSISVTAYGPAVNSVAIYDTIVAAAVEGTTPQDNGKVVFFGISGTYINDVTVGALPDMVTFNHAGDKVLTANEGEPDVTDPNGSVSIIDISGGVANLTQINVTTLDFTSFNSSSLSNVRIFPNKTVAEDLEPEYITVDAKDSLAYVSLQENNALAIVDLTTNTITNIVGLGYKDHSVAGNGLDPSDRDNGINIATHPVWGMYMPDAIASYEVAGNTYIISANEGDARSEDARIKDITLDPAAFPNATQIQEDSVLGRLDISTIDGDAGNDGDYDSLFCYGTRSFTIWNSSGVLVYDSGDDFEQQTALAYPAQFNANNDDNNSFESRSDNKGPEPEAVEIASVGGIHYAFIGLERIGGIMIYDVTTPASPVFIDYVNNRNFAVAATDSAAMDLGVEDILFIDAADSPDGNYYLATANEVSGTVSLFRIDGLPSSQSNLPTSTIQLQARVAPNPVQGNVRLKIGELSETTQATIRIFNLQGQALYQEQQTLNVNSMLELTQTADLAAGTYTLHIQTGEQGFSILFLKK